MTRYARKRIRIAVLAVFCLLFQQVALAAYLCPMNEMPAQRSAMAEHCAGMGMAQAQDNPALCAQHCHPERTAATDAAKLSVPALALPAPVFATIGLPPAVRAVVAAGIPIDRSDPPPRLRYCSLLI